MSNPSLLCVPYRFKTSKLYSQIPDSGLGDFVVSRSASNAATRVNAAGFIETVADNVPRLDYPLGGITAGCPALLVEPAATNGIRNNSMVGAVAGSPGTFPTNWGSSSSGLTRTVVGTGTENGVAYLDIRFNGTATGATIAIAYDANTIVAALQNQVWTHSVYARFTANVLNMPSLRVGMYEFNSGGTYLTEGFGSGVTLTSNLTRLSFTRTLTNASTAFVGAVLQMTIVNGTSYDFTIRIGYPQMEQSSVATSVIPTTTTAITRGAETISKTGVSSLIGQTEGTIYAEVARLAADKCFFSLSNAGDNTNSIRVETTSVGNLDVVIRVSNVITIQITSLSALNIGQFHKIAFGYKQNDCALYVNGVLQGTDTSGAITSGMDKAVFARPNDSFVQDQRVRALELYPTRLPNTGPLSLQSLTQ